MPAPEITPQPPKVRQIKQQIEDTAGTNVDLPPEAAGQNGLLMPTIPRFPLLDGNQVKIEADRERVGIADLDTNIVKEG